LALYWLALALALKTSGLGLVLAGLGLDTVGLVNITERNTQRKTHVVFVYNEITNNGYSVSVAATALLLNRCSDNYNNGFSHGCRTIGLSIETSSLLVVVKVPSGCSEDVEDALTADVGSEQRDKTDGRSNRRTTTDGRDANQSC